MRLRRAVLAAVLSSMFSLPAVGGEPASRPAIDIADLEAHILAARRQITSGEFRIAEPSRAPMYRRVSFHIWFEGPKVRQEVENDDPIDNDNQFHVYILNDKVAFSYGGRPDNFENPDLLHRVAVYTFPAAEADALMSCDPRMAMMVPLQMGLWPRYHLDSFVGGPDRANIAARASVWNGLESIVVSFEDPKRGNRFEYEVVPARNYNIVRWRLANTTRSQKVPIPFEDTYDCDLIEAKQGLWLPHQIRRIYKRDGKTKTDEMTTIDTIGVNSGVEPIRFTLAGGHLAAKQLVIPSVPPEIEAIRRAENPTTAPAHSSRILTRPILWWDGKELRPITPADEAERRASHRAASAPEK
jgi:hypothetical protein